MDCEAVKTSIPSILAGDASEEEHRQVADHLQACSRCRNEEAEMVRIWSMLGRFECGAPSKTVKSSLMAAARMELRSRHPAWWKVLASPSFFTTVLTALGLALIVHLIFPYKKALVLCGQSISSGGIFATVPEGLTYFVLGMLYGLVPVALAEIFCSRGISERPGVMGSGAGLATAAFLVPFFITQCPQFAFSLVLTMVLGITAGTLTGGLGTSMAITRLKTAISR